MLVPKQKSSAKDSKDSSSGGNSSQELAQSPLMLKREEESADRSSNDQKLEDALWNEAAELSGQEESKVEKAGYKAANKAISKLSPFGEEGPEVELGKNKGKVSYKISGSGLNFPPPKGEWDGPSLSMPIATPIPGLFVNISGGLSGGIKIPEVGIEMAYNKEALGSHEDITSVKVEFTLANSDVITASFGGNIRVGVLGGVPLVAAVEAGVEAATEAKIEISPKLSGSAEYLIDGEGNTKSSKAQINAEMGASAGLEASLSLYLAGQIIIFKGDLYKLTLVKKEIASLKGGASLTRTWMNGDKGVNSITPVYDDYFVAENWFQGLFTTDKVDEATAKLTNAQYDVYALEDLKQFLKLGTVTGQTATSKVRIAMSHFRAAEVEYFAKYDELNQADLSMAAKGKINKDLETIMAKMKAANLEWKKAQDEFTSPKSIKNLDKNLSSSEKSLEKTKNSNAKLMQKELMAFEKKNLTERTNLMKAYHDAINSVDQVQIWLSSSPENQKSFYEDSLREANAKKIKANSDLEAFLRVYEEGEAKIRALVETPPKNPVIDQE